MKINKIFSIVLLLEILLLIISNIIKQYNLSMYFLLSIIITVSIWYLYDILKNK
jgi:low temperature requirement protein LtrA